MACMEFEPGATGVEGRKALTNEMSYGAPQ